MMRIISLIATGLLLGSMAPTALNATFSLVPNWANLPDGWVFGHPQGFPLPAARERARAELERARAAGIARGETPPPRQPNLQPGVSGVAVDRDDNVYAFHRGEHPILVFDRHGKFLRSGGDGITGTVPHFIEVDDEGNVWVIDEMAHRVLKFNSDLTEVLLQIGVTDEPGYDSTHLDRPADVDIASTGEILIADGYGNNRIAKFAPDGSFIEQWGGGPQDETMADGGFHLPHAVEIDQNDKVYVLARENHRIQMFDLDGNFLGKWTHLGYAWGLAVSRDGQYAYIAEHDNEQVMQVATATGEVLARWGRHGHGPSEFDWAHGIAVDSTGAVYVADTYGQRLQKFVSDAEATPVSR